MPETKTQTLTTIFSEILADLAFLFVDDGLAEVPSDEEWIETTIGYHGPAKGTLRLRCSRSFSALLAANLLGVDPQDADGQAHADDAIQEFMNIVCGHFVTARHGTQGVFDLTIPKVEALAVSPDLETETKGDADVTTLSVEGHRIQVHYWPDQDLTGSDPCS